MTDGAKVRLFFALWPPRDAARALAGWARAAAQVTRGRPTREETIHLTLAFLGWQEPPRVAAAIDVAAPLAFTPFVPFALQLTEARYWPHNRIVWAGPAVVPAALNNLSAALIGALRVAGFVLEERAFAAHVTLVRGARRSSTLTTLPPLPPVCWPVDDFVLVRSRPSAAGSHYEVLRRFVRD